VATAAELRALAAQLDEIEALEAAALAAKLAYRGETSNPDLRSAHRLASQALADARKATRRSGLSAVDTSPGSMTVIPASVSTERTV
jgi:hypothetical protein